MFEAVKMKNVNALNQREGKRPKVLLRVLRAVLLATSVYALLFWTYVVLRIVFNHVGMNDLFINGVPYFSFWITGIWTFVIGFVSTILYLIVRDPSRPMLQIRNGPIELALKGSFRNKVRDRNRLKLIDSNDTELEMSSDNIDALLNRSDLLEYAVGSEQESQGTMIPAMQVTNNQGKPVIVVVPKGDRIERTITPLEMYEVLIVEDIKGLREETEKLRGSKSFH